MWVNNELFKINPSEVPKVPIEYSEESRAWWAEFKKRCIEGYSVGGKWMPPNLYFYINEGIILLNKTEKSKTKVPAKPFLRDIEWEVFTAWSVARGLSGFLGHGLLGETREDILYNIRHGGMSNIGTPIYDNEARDLLLMGPREFGKASYSKSITYTLEGPKIWKDIVVGDKIYGPDGNLAIVLKVFEQGIQPLYKVTLRDGRFTYCTKEHLWGVISKNDNKKSRNRIGNFIYKVKTTEELLKNYKINRKISIKNPSGFEPKYFLQNTKAIEFLKKELVIDPYTLGLLLGDGCLPHTSKNLIPITMSEEDFNEIRTYIPYESHTINSSNKAHRIHIDNAIDKLNSLQLLDKFSNDKFIPDCYKYSTIEDRLNLIRGLLDTDGTVGKQKSQIEYCTISKKLCDDFMWVCRSVGINCNYTTKKLYTGNTAYRIWLYTDKNIFRLKRKQCLINKNTILAKSRIDKTAIINIEYAFDDDCRCVLLDNESHLYLIDDFIPTHNSYIAGIGVILHEWLFDGAKQYIPGESKEKIIVEGVEEDDFSVTNIVVGAGDKSYADDLMSKAKLGYDFMAKKGIMFNNRYYPHPFFKKYAGSFNNEVVAKYKKKIGGNWLDYGSNSKIRVRSYKDNPYAGQGSRNSVMVKEEIGMFKGLISAQEADIETMKQGTMKFGSCLYIGTGGAMEGGTLDSYRMFFDPATYDILEFNDAWEGKGKISMFISATKRPNQFKDEEGNTKEEEALAYFLKEREKLRNSKNGLRALEAHIQYNPLVPSEIFLRSSGNIFPTSELKSWLAELETNEIYKDAETVCDLIFNDKGIVEPKTVGLDLYPIREFPLSRKGNADTTGAIVIYHHPETNDDGNVPYGRYLAGLDPYQQEDANRDRSLGSLIVFDKLANTIVAEYTGRPKTLYEFYERCRKLLLYYNAQCLYENQILGTKQHFEHKNSLSLLMFQPEYIKDIIPGSKVDRGYGMHMVEQLRDHGLLLIRDWLQDEYEPGKLNLRKIRSIPLLQELILFDFDTNVDRISAMIMLMYALKEKHKELVEEAKQNAIDPFFERRLFRN